MADSGVQTDAAMVVVPLASGSGSTPPTEGEADVNGDEDEDDEDEDYIEFCELAAELDCDLQSRDLWSITSYEDFHSRFYAEMAHKFDIDEGFFQYYYYYLMEEEEFQIYASLRDFESSYLHGCKPSRYSTGLTLDYEKCTPTELKIFINDRRLNDPYPRGLTLKYYYIRVLEAADNDPHFEFMDFPPELRLHVYRFLLILPGGEPEVNNCYTSILQACKQVNEEAHEVLYDENIINCSFSHGANPTALAIQHGPFNQRFRVHNIVYKSGPYPIKFSRIPDSLDDYPEFLRRISRLSISLHHTSRDDNGELTDAATPALTGATLNRCLCSLASFLMDSHRLKMLELDCNFGIGTQPTEIGKILYPLLRLRNVIEIRITGDVPLHMQNRLVSDLRSSEPVFNTVRHWKLLDDEASSRHELLDLWHDEAGCDCGECLPECQSRDELLHHVLHLEESGGQGWTSSIAEERFIACMSELRNKLDMNALEDSCVEVALEKLKKNLSARREYEAVSDEGRFEEAAAASRISAVQSSVADDWAEENDMELHDGVAFETPSTGNTSSLIEN